MKKHFKLLCLMLTICAVCAAVQFLPVRASAATTVSTIMITNVTVPVTGEHADFDLPNVIGNGVTVSSISWCEYGGYPSNADLVFEEQKSYTCRITVRANAGYGFPSGTSGITATVNGNTATVERSTQADRLYIEYTFPKTKIEMNYISIYDVTRPVYGAHPNTTSIRVGYNATISGLNWREVGSNYNMSADDVFVAGHSYTLSMKLTLSSDSNYQFKDAADTTVAFRDTANRIDYGTAGNVTYYANGSFDNISKQEKFVECTYFCEGTKLNYIGIGGLDIPAVGKTIDTDLYQNETPNASIHDVIWDDVTAGTQDLPAGTKFVEGHTYKLKVYITPKAGYYFERKSETEFDYTGNVTVNGDPLSRYSVGNNPFVWYSGNKTLYENDLYVTLLFTMPKIVNSVSVTNLEAPAAGKMPDSTVSISAGAQKVSMSWYDVTKQASHSASKPFEEGAVYKVSFDLIPSSGYQFANNMSVTVNGVAATGAWKEAQGEKYYTVTYTFPATAVGHKHAAGSEWKNDTKNHWHVCSCGETMDADAHTFGEWETISEATENETGLKERTCTVCGYKETANIPVIGHEHAAGSEWRTDSDNHWHECDCGEVMDISGHTFGEWTVVRQATETEAGLREHSCTVCGFAENETIPATGSGTTVVPSEPEESSFPWWIIIVAAAFAAVIAAIVVVVVIVKKKHK
ncbi:MAG: hypothetical protein PUC05_07270 [Firmicutes bacterium]|nr:hypothetical protein [Bacillota bacterium]